jgi:hypothetical protein
MAIVVAYSKQDVGGVHIRMICLNKNPRIDLNGVNMMINVLGFNLKFNEI